MSNCRGGTIILKLILAFYLSLLPLRIYIYSRKSWKPIYVAISLPYCRYPSQKHWRVSRKITVSNASPEYPYFFWKTTRWWIIYSRKPLKIWMSQLLLFSKLPDLIFSEIHGKRAGTVDIGWACVESLFRKACREAAHLKYDFWKLLLIKNYNKASGKLFYWK